VHSLFRNRECTRFGLLSAFQMSKITGAARRLFYFSSDCAPQPEVSAKRKSPGFGFIRETFYSSFLVNP